MIRNTARELAVQVVFGSARSGIDAKAYAEELFSAEHFDTLSEESSLFEEVPAGKNREYIERIAEAVFANLETIDGYIEKYSKSWSLKRISATALAVLRVAVCEIFILKDVPAGSAINSAVEIAKGYDEPETVSFINGVLGSMVRGELSEETSAEA